MLMDYVWAFVFGGLLCVVAQILIDKTKLTPARILVGYVVAGVILGALGLYKPFAEFWRGSDHPADRVRLSHLKGSSRGRQGAG